MASRFDSMFRGGAWPAHLAHFGGGQVVTITPYGGSATTVDAIWNPGRRLYEVLDDGARQASSGVLRVALSEVSGWTPDVRDTVTIDSVAHAVVAIARPDGAPVVELELEAVTQRRIGNGSAYIRR